MMSEPSALDDTRRNATRDPSGDQLGSRSISLVAPVSGSNRRLSLPSGRIVQSFEYARLSMSLANTMRDPSADHAGVWSVARAGSQLSIRFVCPEPLAPMTQMSHSPDRLLRNAIRLPSGDHAG